VLLTYAAFRGMVGLGMLFCLLTAIGFLLRRRVEDYPLYLKVMLYAIPLPHLACALGWTVTEVGRQPWIVYNVMRTSDAASPIDGTQILVTLIGFCVVYGLLGLLGFGLMVKVARRGPETELDTQTTPDAAPE
jgi:cytochrome d ubiquinol oxidase subunit I